MRDVYLVERMMAFRAEQGRRQAEIRRWLLEARQAQPGWLSRQLGRLRCRSGRWLMALGARLAEACPMPGVPARQLEPCG